MEAHALHIDPESHTPIVQQIIDQVQSAIGRGSLPLGAVLPSVRQVASTHGIHPMTVSTAYQRLVALGVLERRRGARLRVRSAPVLSSTERLGQLDTHLHGLLRAAAELAIEPQEVLARMRRLVEAGSNSSA